MTIVTAREANQHFSKFLDAASRGEEVTITRRGKPVAKLVPVGPEKDPIEAAREAAELEAILARFEEGFIGKRLDDWTRDELYDDRIERPWQPDRCE